jgi:hemerythrin-like domain-containing protein
MTIDGPNRALRFGPLASKAPIHRRSAMTLLKTLKADHEKAKAMLRKTLDAEEGKERKSLFAQFAEELTAHSRAEEKILYARLRKSEEGKDEALEGAVEHEVADRLIDDLKRNSNTQSDEWSARCGVLQELLEHHIEEEEDETFETARKLFDTKALEKMGDEFLAEKAKLGIDTKEPAAA